MVNSPISGDAPHTFGQLLRIRPFAVLFVAEAQSLVGDQLARVALAALVWNRTGSAAATAVTYALTFLPAVLGGFLLARIADHLRRLDVMVGCDILRAVLFTTMVLPGMPLIALELLLVVAVFLEPVFTAAQSSYLADSLSDEQYRSATGFRMATNQIGQVGGFAMGGALVALLDPRGALAVNAVTFLLSAVFIDVGLRRRRRPSETVPSVATSSGRYPARQVEQLAPHKPPARRLRTDPRVIRLISLASLAGLFVVPEGLAIPYGHALGVSAGVTGVLLAAIPAGGAVGALLLLRAVSAPRRAAVSAVMVVACGLPLIATGWNPSWPLVALAWFVSGVASAYQVEVFAELARITPSQRRARTIGVAGGFLTGAQGVGLVAFGFVAQQVDVGVAVAAAGALGVLCALAVVALSYRQSTLHTQSFDSIAA